MTAQVWSCPGCGRKYESALPIWAATCSDPDHSRQMKLVQGEMPSEPKRKKKKSSKAKKEKVNPPYGTDPSGRVHGTDKPLAVKATEGEVREMLEELMKE